MHEFETFVYLDVPKTGSDFISSFLRKFCTENKIRSERHVGMEDDYDRSKFYFISVRDPLDQYLSLYSYGCQTDGQLYQRLSKKGFGHLYDGTWNGFQSWLDFVLEPENARLLGSGYAGAQSGRISEFTGYQSYRVMTLAIPQADRLFATCETKDLMSAAYKSHNLVGHTVRHETFRPDLLTLVNKKLRSSISDLDEAIRYIETAQPRNASDRIDRYEVNPTLGKKRQRRLEEREWLMYEIFGY